MRVMHPVRRLPPATSLFLDVVRFGAAFAVAFGHLTQPHFSTGWKDETKLAVKAVGVFFVLSGFVIRYVTRLKYAQISDYWIDRAARIYSVVLPALLFTLFADGTAWWVNPSYYVGNWGPNLGHPVLSLLTNLTFTSQVWSHSIPLFSNGPFWSLSYECFYYVLYGCAFYMTGTWRVVFLMSVAAAAGPHILLLLPLWALGCVIFDLYEWLSRCAIPDVWLHAAFAGAGFTGLACWRMVYNAIFYLKRSVAAVFITHHHQPVHLRWTVDYYGVGIPAAFLILWCGLVLNQWRTLSNGSSIQRSIQLLAEGTFPLYLFHFPFFVLVAAILRYDRQSSAFKLGMLMTAIAFSAALAVPTNRLKAQFREGLRRLQREQKAALTEQAS